MVDIDDPTVEPATAVAPTSTAPALRAVFCGDRVLFKDFALENARTDAGRAALGPHDITLEHDPRVSRQHACFVVTAGGALRVENRSANGSFVNGARVDDGADLHDGDVVRLGDTFLVVRWLPDAPRDVRSRTLLGRAPAMQQLRSLIDVVAPTKASVVLLGETGAGKELAARALHDRSGRAGPFVAVNCAAIPEHLAESQLFGHRAGAFTGATRDHAGFFGEAQGGTLFLDEVGELPLLLQPKLLRVLDGGAVVAVGATSGVPADVRVLAATNREIAREVSEGRFRADLFARLAEITVALPPLRARKEDVLLLLQHALPALESGAQKLSPALVSALLVHHWPFNVRELVKIATELEVKAQGRALLDLDLLEGRLLGPQNVPAPVAVSPKHDGSIPTREALVALVEKHAGRVSDVAKATGRSRTQVYRWLEQHKIDVAAYRRAPE